ncbi:unnamed protein product [Cyprideis torosa]|uniref:CCR4-NOT transcription complex subunit 4 n=1 Tax=Cyprideis torosa TaxID=163714 RepID=A0A7R8ZJ74_9CRUS|nr:unnamed protein product [Cyprideis torosa]CAG0886272.1 unnamed protein product [Cyprideis torosa]
MSLLNTSDDLIECPLCMEPLEADDLKFYPCTCEYQICRFCWHRIRTDENGLCPACRKPYEEDPADFQPLTHEEVLKIKAEKKQRENQRKKFLSENRKHLSAVRVVQRNLVFVVGLPARLSDPDVLKKHEYFGKFGKILKVAINHATGYAGQASSGGTSAAYITYARAEDAVRAIQAVTNIHVDGKTIKASLGTTKYCSQFLKNLGCSKSDCMYLHELGDDKASFTKEEMQQGRHQDYERILTETYLGKGSYIARPPSSSSPLASGGGSGDGGDGGFGNPVLPSASSSPPLSLGGTTSTQSLPINMAPSKRNRSKASNNPPPAAAPNEQFSQESGFASSSAGSSASTSSGSDSSLHTGASSSASPQPGRSSLSDSSPPPAVSGRAGGQRKPLLGLAPPGHQPIVLGGSEEEEAKEEPEGSAAPVPPEDTPSDVTVKTEVEETSITMTPGEQTVPVCVGSIRSIGCHCAGAPLPSTVSESVDPAATSVAPVVSKSRVSADAASWYPPGDPHHYQQQQYQQQPATSTAGLTQSSRRYPASSFPDDSSLPLFSQTTVTTAQSLLASALRGNRGEANDLLGPASMAYPMTAMLDEEEGLGFDPIGLSQQALQEMVETEKATGHHETNVSMASTAGGFHSSASFVPLSSSSEEDLHQASTSFPSQAFHNRSSKYSLDDHSGHRLHPQQPLQHRSRLLPGLTLLASDNPLDTQAAPPSSSAFSPLQSRKVSHPPPGMTLPTTSTSSSSSSLRAPPGFQPNNCSQQQPPGLSHPHFQQPSSLFFPLGNDELPNTGNRSGLVPTSWGSKERLDAFLSLLPPSVNVSFGPSPTSSHAMAPQAAPPGLSTSAGSTQQGNTGFRNFSSMSSSNAQIGPPPGLGNKSQSSLSSWVSSGASSTSASMSPSTSLFFAGGNQLSSSTAPNTSVSSSRSLFSGGVSQQPFRLSEWHDPAIVSAGEAPPHWLQSLEQLTCDDPLPPSSLDGGLNFSASAAAHLFSSLSKAPSPPPAPSIFSSFASPPPLGRKSPASCLFNDQAPLNHNHSLLTQQQQAQQHHESSSFFPFSSLPPPGSYPGQPGGPGGGNPTQPPPGFGALLSKSLDRFGPTCEFERPASAQKEVYGGVKLAQRVGSVIASANELLSFDVNSPCSDVASELKCTLMLFLLGTTGIPTVAIAKRVGDGDRLPKAAALSFIKL